MALLSNNPTKKPLPKAVVKIHAVKYIILQVFGEIPTGLCEINTNSK